MADTQQPLPARRKQASSHRLGANIYLSTLERHSAERSGNRHEPRLASPTSAASGLAELSAGPLRRRLHRDAVDGDRSDAEAIRAQIGELLAHQLQITLSADKTHITHIDDRCRLPGLPHHRTQAPEQRTSCRAHLPVHASLARAKTKIKRPTERGTTSLRQKDVLRHINPILRSCTA